MSPRVPLPDELGDFFAVGRAIELGVGPRRLAGPDLRRPFWGVRTVGPVSDLRSLARAYAVRMPPLAVFSHATAAQLWSIPLPLHLEAALLLHVSVPAPRRAPEGVGIVGHRMSIGPEDVTTVQGVPVSTLQRTVLDLAPYLDNEHLLGVIDNILWRRRPFAHRATRASLEACLGRFQGRRGRSRVESLLPFATDRSDSIPESVFRHRFNCAGFPDPIPNGNIYDANGHFIAMPDIQFRRYRMAFDYEGDHHRTDARQWRKDLQRVPRLEDAQWHHTRISGDDLADPRELLERTRRRLIERGWTG